MVRRNSISPIDKKMLTLDKAMRPDCLNIEAEKWAAQTKTTTRLRFCTGSTARLYCYSRLQCRATGVVLKMRFTKYF
jgi:hypothetical protein